MPPMKIIGSLSTRPFASDDLQIFCLVNGTYRIIQLCCIIPLWVFLYVRKVNGSGASTPHWCPQESSNNNDSKNHFNSTPWMAELVPFDEEDSSDIDFWLSTYLIMSTFFIVANLFLLAAIWSASSVGTPTQPMGREKFLRPLLQTRTFVIAILEVALIILGIQLVAVGRRENWGCEGEYVKGGSAESTGWYTLLCATIMMQAIEVFFLPAALVARSAHWLKKHATKRVKKEMRGRSLDSCLTGCLKCFGCLCGKRSDIPKTGEMRDAAEAVLDFFSRGVPYTWSDLYVSLHMVNRLQHVQRLHSIRRALGENRKNLDLKVACATAPRTLLSGTIGMSGGVIVESVSGAKDQPLRSDQYMVRSQSVFFQREAMNEDYRLAFRKALVAKDIMIIKNAIRYARHSTAVYGDLMKNVEGYLDMMNAAIKGGNGWFQAQGQQHYLDMERIGFEKTSLVYSNFVNGISKTPYYIAVDEDNKEVILAIRGTASLEDAVIDLQLTPANLRDIGKKCGFDGENEFCHKGVLTRCIWIYEDLRRHGLLDTLVGGENPCHPDYSLILTGHSLGAGCAAVLSCMVRKQLPEIRCYAFCPPGGLVSESLARHTEEFVTSFVNNADIIPRMSLSNMEKLRDECFEVLARIKVSKIQLFRALRLPCSAGALGAMNDLLLCQPEETPRDTKFYRTLEAYREKLASCSNDVRHTPLLPPGRILNMIRTENTTSNNEKNLSSPKVEFTYAPQWAKATDFNEIVVSGSLVEDHTLNKVLESLEKIFDLLSTPNNSFPDQMDLMSKAAELELDEKDLTILTNRNFICCSRPHGNVTILMAALSTVAFALTIVSNNHCALVQRSTEWVAVADNLDDGYPNSFQGISIPTGLFNLEQKFYGGEGNYTDPNSYVESGVCSPFPSWFVADSWLKGARAFGSLASLMGAIVLSILWTSGCHRYQRKPWRLVWIFSMLAFVFQGLVFVFVFNAELCDVYELNEGHNDFLIYAECDLAWGSKMAMGAMMVWFLVILLTFRYPEPRF